MNDLAHAPEMEALWTECLRILETSLEKPTFETCFKNTRLLSLEKNSCTLGVSPFAKSWIKKKGKCQDLISEALQSVSGKKLNLHIVEVEDDGSGAAEESPSCAVQETKNGAGHRKYTMNPKHTFDTFIVGDSNQFASAACRAVSESPGKAYNPLFIYGGVGLGKTHLLHAIGNKVAQDDRSSKIVYVSTETFTTELISSLGDHHMAQFKEKYRNVDVLLIDDIQFLINKEKTQEEFFYTFNALHETQKQIVITSDRPPREIPTLHDRLRSRFEWGLLADISFPDIETREAILRKKADMEKISISADVISYIASKIPSNIRELEGALTRVIAYASFNKKKISMDIAEEALKGILPDLKEKLLTPEIIQKKVSDYFAIKITDMTSEKRDKRFSYPRHIAMFLTKELTNLSFPDTAKAFRKKDHSTVLHACKKISALLEDDPSTKACIENVKNLLKEQT